MNKQQVISKYDTYELREGNYVKKEASQSINPLTSIDSGKATFLRGNPFLYNPQTAVYQINSLEEYLIKAGRIEMAFGDVIRNPEFSDSKRRKYVKKAFRKWNKDYNSKKKIAFSENDKIVEVIGEISYLKFSWKMKILLYFLFIFLLIVVGSSSYIWTFFARSSVGLYFQNVLNDLYSSFAWLQIVGNLSIYIILTSIFYASIYSIISKDFSKNYQLAQSYLNRSEKTISRTYTKKFRKARKYYLSHMRKRKNKYYPPLGIEEIQEGDMSIDIFRQICQVLVERSYRYKKSKPFVVGFRNVLILLSIAGAACLFVFLVYGMILTIF